MVEVTTPVIDPSPRGNIRYDTVDSEKGTIASGYKNPEDRNKPNALKAFVNKYGPRAWLKMAKLGLGLNSPWTPEEQAKLNDLKARKNQTVGSHGVRERVKRAWQGQEPLPSRPQKT